MSETFLFADEPPSEQPNTGSPQLEKLLDWLINHWPRQTISAAELYNWGPTCIRDRKLALELAGILEKHRWLRPLKTHRHDRRVWQINRGPIPTPLTGRISTTAT